MKAIRMLVVGLVLFVLTLSTSVFAKDMRLPESARPALQVGKPTLVTEGHAGAHAVERDLQDVEITEAFAFAYTKGAKIGFVEEAGFIPFKTQLRITKGNETTETTMIDFKDDIQVKQLQLPAGAEVDLKEYFQSKDRQLPVFWPSGDYGIEIRIYPVAGQYWRFKFTLAIASFDFWLEQVCASDGSPPTVSLPYYFEGKVPSYVWIVFKNGDQYVLGIPGLVKVSGNTGKLVVDQKTYDQAMGGRLLETIVFNLDTGEDLAKSFWYPSLPDMIPCVKPTLPPVVVGAAGSAVQS